MVGRGQGRSGRRAPGGAAGAQPASAPGRARDGSAAPPLDDPSLARTLELADLAERWAPYAAMRPISAEAMTGADQRAQRLGVSGERLMEQAGAAVAAAARAVLHQAHGSAPGTVLVLAGPGNNGGDGLVAARHLAAWGIDVAVVLVSGDGEFSTRDARRNWERLEGAARVQRMHAGSARDITVLRSGIERAALLVDALLGTGVRGRLREPIRSAVELTASARAAGVPVVSVDCPTALDLTSGEPSDPVVRADVTVTFHRPKTGLQTRLGRALAGKVLVAPIGIPPAADLA